MLRWKKFKNVGKEKLIELSERQQNIISVVKCHPANTIRVVDALIRANKRFDMLLLPGQRHGFGDMNEYFYWRLVDFFSEHLKGKSETLVDIPQR